MLRDDGNLQALTGGLKLKIRIQHPGVHERTDRGGSYWYFRYWEDVLQAEVARDKFVATINRPTIQEKVVDGLALFSKMVEKYRAAHVEAEAAGRFLLAKHARQIHHPPRAAHRPTVGRPAFVRDQTR